jgi:hypothetical protein
VGVEVGVATGGVAAVVVECVVGGALVVTRSADVVERVVGGALVVTGSAVVVERVVAGALVVTGSADVVERVVAGALVVTGSAVVVGVGSDAEGLLGMVGCAIGGVAVGLVRLPGL